MLSEDERRILAEIERHLGEDRVLHRAAGAVGRPVSWARRAWLALLWVSLVLMVGMAALQVAAAVAESAALVLVAEVGLRRTVGEPDDRAGQNPARHRAA
jgi:hypothetical protein